MRLIDANKLIEKLSRMIDFVEKDKTVNALNALFQVGDAIMDCPTVDAVPVVHGHWEWTGLENAYRCSVCKRHPVCGTLSNYCPNCGSKMDEDSTSTENGKNC